MLTLVASASRVGAFGAGSLAGLGFRTRTLYYPAAKGDALDMGNSFSSVWERIR